MTMTAATMTDQEFLALETAYWDAMMARDARAVSRLTADDCTIVGASGIMAIGPASIGKLVEAAPYTIREYRIDPRTVRIARLDDNSVAIAYGVHEELEVEGRPVTLDAFDASVWQRQGGPWACVLHTESIAGDAFGRDRSKPTKQA